MQAPCAGLGLACLHGLWVWGLSLRYVDTAAAPLSIIDAVFSEADHIPLAVLLNSNPRYCVDSIGIGWVGLPLPALPPYPACQPESSKATVSINIMMRLFLFIVLPPSVLTNSNIIVTILLPIVKSECKQIKILKYFQKGLQF